MYKTLLILLLVAFIVIGIPIITVLCVMLIGVETTKKAQNEAGKVSSEKVHPQKMDQSANEQKGNVQVSKNPEDTEESFYHLYLNKFIYKNYPGIVSWRYGNPNTIHHHSKMFVVVKLLYPTGLEDDVSIKTTDVYAFAMKEQHIQLGFIEQPTGNSEEETIIIPEKSNADKWLEKNSSLISARKSSASALDQKAFTVEAPELTRDELIELANLLMDKAAYNTSVSENEGIIFVEFDD